MEGGTLEPTPQATLGSGLEPLSGPRPSCHPALPSGCLSFWVDGGLL